MAYFIMSETIKGLFFGRRNKAIAPQYSRLHSCIMGHDVTTNLPLHLTWVISWILLKIQILVRLFIQKGREIRKSTIHCVHYLSFRWLRAYS